MARFHDADKKEGGGRPAPAATFYQKNSAYPVAMDVCDVTTRSRENEFPVSVFRPAPGEYDPRYKGHVIMPSVAAASFFHIIRTFTCGGGATPVHARPSPFHVSQRGVRTVGRLLALLLPVLFEKLSLHGCPPGVDDAEQGGRA